MKRHAPAADRNKAFIAEVLREELIEPVTLLEIASGTGQHAVHFARALPHVTIQPSDVDPDALASIEAYRAEAELHNLRPPKAVDVVSEDWGTEADAILCCNMIHIAPWSAALGLLKGAGRALPSGGPLFLYGPFRFEGRFTAPSNETFDASLRARDPAWGVRDVVDVSRRADEEGLTRERIVDMPANNHVLVFRKR